MLLFAFLLFAGSPTLRICQGVKLSPCRNNVTEVTEGRATSVTCSGLDSTQTVTWNVIYSTSGSDGLGVCDEIVPPATTSTCTAGSLPGLYTASRPTPNTSVMTVNTSAANNGAIYVTGYTLWCSQNPTAQDQCTMDLVYPPDTVSCSAQFLTPSDVAWSLSGRCNVTKVYSFLGRYTCQWYQKHAGSAETPLGQPVPIRNSSVSGDKYINGACEVTAAFPRKEGQYSYRVVLTPGDVNQTATVSGTSLIRQPATSHDCPRYVIDGQSVTCTCSDDVGSPQGVAQWSGTDSSQLTVTSAMAGQPQTCHVIYNNRPVSPVTYTAERAYGPSGVSITGASPFDTNGSATLDLTCTLPGGSNPAPTFQWTRPSSSDVIHRAQSYAFQPRVSADDGLQLSCTARNNVTALSRKDTFTVTLNYPPTTDPVITDNSTDSHLYQGDSVTLTCRVEGGKPFNATRLTFNCPGQDDSPDVTGSTGVSSSVTFDSLSDNNHKNVCTCSTKWKTTGWYSKRLTRQLFVNSPPSTPRIEAPPGVDQYPFLASVTHSATLTCDSSSPGRPSATYTWPVHQGGRQGNDTRGRGTLTFDTVSKEHDGKRVSCRANNRYTTNRQPVDVGSFILHVYYPPEVSVSPVTDSSAVQCQTLSNSAQCLVTEGQRVHFRCTAVSNPPPTEYAWTPGSRNSSDLVIESANHTQHTGTVNCTVATGLGNRTGDPRLPLKGWSAVTLLVKYETSVTSFTLNSVVQTNVTVNSNDAVSLTCRANGRPSPAMWLTRPDGQVLTSRPQGTPQLQDQEVDISSNITAQCTDMGVYTCDTNNGVGTGQKHNVTVFVRCAPHQDANVQNIPQINYRTGEERLNFTVTGFPTPELKEVLFYRQKPNETSIPTGRKTNKFSVTFTRLTAASPNITCQVTIGNITSSDSGFFEAIVGNALGNTSLRFEVTVNATSKHDVPPAVPVLAVVSGIIAAVLVIVGVVTAVLLFKRRKANRKSAQTSGRDTEENEQPEMIDNVIYGTAEPGATTQKGATNCNQASPYEDIVLAETSRGISQIPLSQEKSASHTSDMYASVDKGNLYAVVDKTKKASSPPAHTGSSNDGRSKPVVKPKPGAKFKQGKSNMKEKAQQKHGKDDEQPLRPLADNSPGSLYSNVTPLTMMPPQSQGTEYENFGFRNEDDDKEQEGPNNGSAKAHPDGPTYTTIAFTEEQRKKAELPAPERETVEYVDIDFTKRG